MQSRRLFLAALIAITAISASMQAQSVATHHVWNVVHNGEAKLIGNVPSDQLLTLDIVLAVRNQLELDAFVAAVTNPNSPSYRHFLTPAQFTSKFGPTEADYQAVVDFARSNGLEVTGGSRDGLDVQVKAPIAAVESAFHVHLRTYHDPVADRDFYAPDTEPTTSLPFALWHISGLDNYSVPRPLYVSKTAYAQAHGISPEAVNPLATTGSGPSASFLGSDMRAAYYGGSLTGAGQNLGLLEYHGTDLVDLTTYFHNVNQTNNVPITLYSTDGTSTSCVYPSCDDTEQTLDMTQAIGMAPGLASLTMYIGSTDTAMISKMTTHSPLPTTIGSSWTWSNVDPSTLNPYFEKMATQGQNFFQASGDHSTWSSSNDDWPADDAYVVTVGGTDLNTASAGGPWQSETAWVDSGGGISPNSIPIPSWQQLSGVINSSNHGSTTLRNGPDVSANSNFSFYTCADQTACLANEYGGTSFAAPMWAAFIALANQQLAATSQPLLGYLDPLIYAENTNAQTYATDFHDIVSGTSGSYSAVTGYDLVTGWGSPKAALITTLTTPANPPAATPTINYINVNTNGGGPGGSNYVFTFSINETTPNYTLHYTLNVCGQPPYQGTSTTGYWQYSCTGPGNSGATATIYATAPGYSQSASIYPSF